MEHTDLHLTTLFPELRAEIRVHCDMYSWAAVRMTCHHFWDRDTEEAAEARDGFSFFLNFLSNVGLNAPLTYLQWNWTKRCITALDKQDFFAGICLRNDLILFRCFWNRLLRFRSVNEEARIDLWTRIHTTIFRAGHRETVEYAVQHHLYRHVKKQPKKELKWLLRGLTQDPEPDVTLVLEFFAFLHDVTTDDWYLEPERLLLMYCLKERRMKTLLACCEQNESIRTFFKTRPWATWNTCIRYHHIYLEFDEDKAERLNVNMVAFLEDLLLLHTVSPARGGQLCTVILMPLIGIVQKEQQALDHDNDLVVKAVHLLVELNRLINPVADGE